MNKRLRKLFGPHISARTEDDLVILEGQTSNWNDLVRAGLVAAKHLRLKPNLKKPGAPPLYGLVNNITFTGAAIPPMSVPTAGGTKIADNCLEGMRPDVMVIGGGVTGCAIARELCRYNLEILLVEKEHDLGMHASSRNDGMVHPGLDLHKGSLKHYYNSRGNALYDEVCKDLGVPFERIGQYLCFHSFFMLPVLFASLLYWKWLKVPGARVISGWRLRRREPGLSKDIKAALFFPSAGIVCPFNLTIAYGENAVQNNGRISLDTAVLGIEWEDWGAVNADGSGRRIRAVKTNRGTIYPRVVINAAGVFAEDIAAMAGDRFFSIHPRRGTNSILDKNLTGSVVNGIASTYAKGEAHSKGGGIIRTVHGNILVGPDAVETWEKENFATHRESIDRVFAKFQKTSPLLKQGDIINYFTGVRAATYEEDFVVCKGRRTENIVHAAGIQSPGLTAAPAIAMDVARFAVELLTDQGRHVKARENFNPRRVPAPHLSGMAKDQREALIKENPDYGLIVCRCEEVSKGEILDSLRRPVPCDTLEGVKRRARPGGGRCLGSFCGPVILQLIAAEKGIPLEKVMKSGPGSEVLCGPVKGTP
ncbi:MAG: NAD(P)/FAD-dependent oxidoreductase [Treponema sp.]|nr:NAD(P)/FAD-dependent oxidoreductase [Treponema sp.]